MFDTNFTNSHRLECAKDARAGGPNQNSPGYSPQLLAVRCGVPAAVQNGPDENRF